jgi:hypothetical protein
MGYSINEVKHLKLFVEKNKISLDNIEIIGETIESAKVSIKKVELNKAVSDAFKVKSQNACSSCMNAFLLSCQMLKDRSNIPISLPVEVYMGSGWKNTNIGCEGIAFGNCAARNLKNCISVKGCPPFPFELKKVLEKLL